MRPTNSGECRVQVGGEGNAEMVSELKDLTPDLQQGAICHRLGVWSALGCLLNDEGLSSINC